MNAATQNLNSLWTGHKIVYRHGTRFISSGSNALACFVSFDLLKTLMQKCQKTSIGAAEILTMIENPELYKQLAIMSRLSIFVKEFPLLTNSSPLLVLCLMFTPSRFIVGLVHLRPDFQKVRRTLNSEKANLIKPKVSLKTN